MKLWSIQTEPAWQSLMQLGVLRVPRDCADRDFVPAYDWMANQMHDRIEHPPPRGVSIPIWAWQQYDGSQRKRPDLRSAGHLPSGTRGYRIGFTIPEDHVLLSDFEMWHYALNYSFLAPSESDAETFDQLHPNLTCSWHDPPTDQDVDYAIKNSWHRMFDLDWNDPCISLPKDQKSIQATLWQLEKSWVTTVEEFVAR